MELEWKRVHEGVKQISSNVRFKLTQFNIVHQTYLTPHVLHRIYPDRSAHCPKCGQADAQFLHMIWECTELKSYWGSILERLRLVTGWTLPYSIKEELLGLLPRPKGRKLTQRFLQLGLVLAKRRIAIRWMSSQPPKMEN